MVVVEGRSVLVSDTGYVAYKCINVYKRIVQKQGMPLVDILHRSTNAQNTEFNGEWGLFQIFMAVSWKNCSIWKQVSLAQRKTFKRPVFLLKVKR